MKLGPTTLVPIGFVAGAIVVGIAWGTLTSSSKTQADELDKVEKKQEHYNAHVQRIDRRLSRIEGALEIKVPKEDQKINADDDE